MSVYKFLEKFYLDSTRFDFFIVENDWEKNGGHFLEGFLTAEEAQEKYGNRCLLKWTAITVDCLDVIEMVLVVSSAEI